MILHILHFPSQLELLSLLIRTYVSYAEHSQMVAEKAQQGQFQGTSFNGRALLEGFSGHFRLRTVASRLLCMLTRLLKARSTKIDRERTFGIVPQQHIDRSQPAVTGSAAAQMERLLSEKVSLESDLGRRLEMLHVSQVAAEDQPSIIHDQFISLHRNNLAYTRLREIEAAMGRIRSGDYGVCEGCEIRIPDRRLKAIPWARYCLTCQENVGADRDKQKEHVRLVA